MSSIRQQTTHDSYAYVPWRMLCRIPSLSSYLPLSHPLTHSLSLSPSCLSRSYTLRSRSLSLSLTLSVPTTSFECTPLIFWLSANTDTAKESVVSTLEAVAEDLSLFAKEVCPLLLLEDLQGVFERWGMNRSLASGCRVTEAGSWRKLTERILRKLSNNVRGTLRHLLKIAHC